jgi:hypothetical protein
MQAAWRAARSDLESHELHLIQVVSRDLRAPPIDLQMAKNPAIAVENESKIPYRMKSDTKIHRLRNWYIGGKSRCGADQNNLPFRPERNSVEERRIERGWVFFPGRSVRLRPNPEAARFGFGQRARQENW